MPRRLNSSSSNLRPFAASWTTATEPFGKIITSGLLTNAAAGIERGFEDAPTSNAAGVEGQWRGNRWHARSPPDNQTKQPSALSSEQFHRSTWPPPPFQAGRPAPSAGLALSRKASRWWGGYAHPWSTARPRAVASPRCRGREASAPALLAARSALPSSTRPGAAAAPVAREGMASGGFVCGTFFGGCHKKAAQVQNPPMAVSLKEIPLMFIPGPSYAVAAYAAPPDQAG